MQYSRLKCLFIDYIIQDMALYIRYQKGEIYCTYPLDMFKIYNLDSMKFLSAEQNLPVSFSYYPRLTSDLTIRIVKVTLMGENLTILVSKMKDVRKININKQIKAAYARLRNIYPYSLFNVNSIRIEYVEVLP